MPFDNVYREKRCQARCATADFLWRRAGDDRFYGVIALLLLSLFGSLLAPYALDQQFLGYQLLPPSGRATATCRSFSAPTISGATSSAVC